jgi:hypothetical protein
MGRKEEDSDFSIEYVIQDSLSRSVAKLSFYITQTKDKRDCKHVRKVLLSKRAKNTKAAECLKVLLAQLSMDHILDAIQNAYINGKANSKWDLQNGIKDLLGVRS